MSQAEGDVVSNLLKPDFIQYLIKKLKTGNLRGSHLNCLPGKTRNRFSLFDLERIVGSDFLKCLTEKSSFSLRIEIPPVQEEEYEKLLENPNFIKSKDYESFVKDRIVLVRRLNNITYDLKNEIQEYGTKSFGFGYPTVVIQDPKKPEKILIAPLLIWYLELKQDSNKSNSWTLSKSEDSPIVFNEVLFNYLKESHGVSFEDFKDIQERILEDGTVDWSEIQELISVFQKKLNQGGKNSLIYAQESKCEDYENKESLTERLGNERLKTIHNGAFAFYRTFKESIIQDMETLLKNLNTLETELGTSYQLDFLSAVPTDPSQSKLLESLGSEKNILVQGPPGTGKSQSLTAILTNALKNKAKCLVVCEKKTAMEILYSNLKKLGLGSLAVMVDDPIKDRNKVIESVRGKIDSVEPAYDSSSLESSFDAEFVIYKNSREKLENHHRVKNSKQLDESTRQDLIGKFLKSYSAERPTLKSLTSDFEFSSDTYREAKSLLGQFDILSVFIHKGDALELISTKFIESEYVLAKKALVDILTALIGNLDSFEENTGTIIEHYKNKSVQDTKIHAEKLTNFIEALIAHYESLSESAKKRLDYDDLSINVSVRILANVSSLNKEILLFKRNMHSDLLKINELLKENIFFQKLYIEDFAKQNIKTLLSKLKEINVFCESTNVELLIAKYIEEICLNSKLLISGSGIEELVKKVIGYNILIDQGYFKADRLNIPMDVNLNSLSRIAREKNTILKPLNNRLDYLHEYYSLMKFINEQSPNMQNLLNQILIIPRNEWDATFEEWFIHNFLSKNSSLEVMRNDQDIRKIIRAEKNIRNLYPKLILSYWNGEVNRLMRTYQSKPIALKSLYNLRGANGKRRNSLRTILNYDFESFSTFFPVVLTNPSIVSSIMPLKLGLFDIVIFDEASQLRIEDTLSSFIRGKIHVVSGDKYQMPPSSFFISDVDISDDDEKFGVPNEIEDLEKSLEKNHLYSLIMSESLLDFADQLHFKQVYLDIHYRSKHPDLIEFSNKAFYGSRLIPTPPLISDEQAIHYHEINGLYHSEDQTNLQECEQVIKIIEEEYHKNPSLKMGVATLNLNQRNSILDKLSELSAKDEKFALMMNELDKNGFFVKNLENIQGDERDIIIISTTFGRREDGSFIQNFGPLTRKGGYRLLNVIITRAKERLHLVTSIPEDYYIKYDKLLMQDGNDGKAIFYAYIAYAKAVSKNDNVQKEIVLKNLAAVVDLNETDRVNLDLTESPFEEEVYQRMAHVIPKEKIHLQQKVGGFRLDIVVETEDAKRKIAIECDGATYHRSEEDHYWDVFRQEYLEAYGYIFYRIWSENWFEDPSSEMRKLLAFIEANNGIVNKST